MALSLGEKLRMAREERGISIAEVAEQTRISPLYLEAIDQNDYKTLPGGIFNKGFVRSYAKYVGVDEQEALQDYSRMMSENATEEDSEIKAYRPEVLTDDRSASSIVPTIIFAAIIIGLMSAGLLFLVNYIRNERSEPPIAANGVNNGGFSNNATADQEAPLPSAGNVPTMGNVRVEFRSIGSEIWVNAESDGTKSSSTVSADKPVLFEPKERLTISYSKSLAKSAQLTINGKPIALPESPSSPKKGLIELDINKDNLGMIWQKASFDVEAETSPQPSSPEIAPSSPPAAEPTAATTQTPTPTPKSTPKPSPAPSVKPTASNSNAAPPTMSGRPPARPTATPRATRTPEDGDN